MRAAKIKEHPGFLLMKQTDVQSIYYMQMPRWLFSDPRYADMNLDAKVTYTFLLNRFQLSRRKGWVNDQGEVFVIFPRLALAEELRICEKRVTAAFRALAERELIWEKRCRPWRRQSNLSGQGGTPGRSRLPVRPFPHRRWGGRRFQNSGFGGFKRGRPTPRTAGTGPSGPVKTAVLERAEPAVLEAAGSAVK